MSFYCILLHVIAYYSSLLHFIAYYRIFKHKITYYLFYFHLFHFISFYIILCHFMSFYFMLYHFIIDSNARRRKPYHTEKTLKNNRNMIDLWTMTKLETGQWIRTMQRGFVWTAWKHEKNKHGNVGTDYFVQCWILYEWNESVEWIQDAGHNNKKHWLKNQFWPFWISLFWLRKRFAQCPAARPCSTYRAHESQMFLFLCPSAVVWIFLCWVGTFRTKID